MIMQIFMLNFKNNFIMNTRYLAFLYNFKFNNYLYCSFNYQKKRAYLQGRLSRLESSEILFHNLD